MAVSNLMIVVKASMLCGELLLKLPFSSTFTLTVSGKAVR